MLAGIEQRVRWAWTTVLRAELIPDTLSRVLQILSPVAESLRFQAKHLSRCAIRPGWSGSDGVGMGPGVVLRRNIDQSSMSALGQKRTSGLVKSMSALPPKADIDRAHWDVRFVPVAAIRWLFDHLVSAPRQRQRHSDAQHLCRLQIDDEFDFRGLLHWQVGRFLTL